MNAVYLISVKDDLMLSGGGYGGSAGFRPESFLQTLKKETANSRRRKREKTDYHRDTNVFDLQPCETGQHTHTHTHKGV